ncbi:hypothetical protein ABPG74_000653 [Tetrahymena malaccensis]
MLYFFIGMFALAVLIVHIISFEWFQSNQDNNYHKIIDLWLKDPLEKLYLKDINQDCPTGTSTFNLQYDYPGKSGLCTCVQGDTYYGQNNKNNNRYYNNHHRILQANLFECSQINCDPTQVSSQVVKPINSVNLNYFFYNITDNTTQKVCVSKVPGYSFALKAPLENQCKDYEKYCDFRTTSKSQFDIDQGYCIPQDQECQIQGVNLGGYTQSIVDQLPIVDISISTKQKSEAYNINVYTTISAINLLNFNNITYDSQYISFLTEEFQINVVHMPRVKLRCRQQLQQNLSSYIGPQSAYQISLVLLILSVLSCSISFIYVGWADIFQMNVCLAGCQNYLESKRPQKKYSTFKNSMIILSPILVVLIIILDGIMILYYTHMVDYMIYMINDKCLDEYVTQYLNYYNNTASPGFYPEGLTYTGLLIAGIQLLLDQMFYLSIKKVILFVYSIVKCKKGIKKPTNIQTETVTNSNNMNQVNKKQNIQNFDTPNLNGQAGVSTVTPFTPQAPNIQSIFVDKCKNEEIINNFDKQKTESNQLKYITSSLSKNLDDGQNKFLTSVFILGKSSQKRESDIELNLQQSQLINTNNFQQIPKSTQPIYQNQQNYIKGLYQQNNQKRNSQDIQLPKAPLPPEPDQSEKSKFSILNLDNI